MEMLGIISLIGFLCIICFIVGARVGQAVVKGETISNPIPNPVKVIEEYKENKEYEEEQQRIEIMMENINNYNGTGLGQKDIY